MVPIEKADWADLERRVMARAGQRQWATWLEPVVPDEEERGAFEHSVVLD